MKGSRLNVESKVVGDQLEESRRRVNWSVFSRIVGTSNERKRAKSE